MSIASAPPAPPRSRLPARHRVREEIQRMIVGGERPSGSKLRQHELAQHFGVAPLVVREALLELRALGLVETVDNRGAFVAELNRELLLASYVVREALEGMAARLCCQRVTRLETAALREIAERIFAEASAGRFEEGGRLDRQFHDRLIHFSGNPLMIRLAEQYRWISKIVSTGGDAAQTRRDHLDILKAIEDGRGDDAEDLMRRHIRQGRGVVEREMAKPDFVLSWL